ncbi:MAG: FKBP-type peptidyl-prolyl cis-trans isomerase [Magnetococcales bacterium]|nr:FKBP-type peptidyl-prolyl cis-trans isomerase [Magnetococcales bacterium]
MQTLRKIFTMLINLFFAKALGGFNQRRGAGYREANGRRPGVVTTKTGLQYEVLRPSAGPQPGFGSRVTVHYRGSLINGVVFDSSYDRNDPLVIKTYEVISGWSDGLKLMNEGAQFRFVIPPEEAYGPKGAGMVIGPNETLVFEVELLKVEG